MEVTAAFLGQCPPNMRIPSQRPPPARRRTTQILAFVFLITLFSIITPATAFQRSRFEVRKPLDEQWENEIVFDPRPVPKLSLQKRQFDLDSSTTAKSKTAKKTSTDASSPTTTSDSSSTTASASDSAQSTDNGGILTAPVQTSASIPTAFDGGLGTNYTQSSCPSFLRKLMNDNTLTKCIPISLLLLNSQAFFTASRSTQSLDPILSASCNIPNPSSCSSLIANYATTLRSSSVCSQDYNQQQPIVRQAYNGLISYDVLFRAICTKAIPSAANNNSADFCFSNAVTNTSSPTSSYIYYLPLGVALPAGSLPSCSKCLQDTMAIFGTASRNKTQPVSDTWYSAAQQINLNCGPGFVNQSTASGSSKNAGERASRPDMSLTYAAGFFTLMIGAFSLV